MSKKAISLLCSTVLVIWQAGETSAQVMPGGSVGLGALPECPQGTLFEPYTSSCATVNDITRLFSSMASVSGSKDLAITKKFKNGKLVLPNLEELRDRDALDKGVEKEQGAPALVYLPSSGLDGQDEPPVPGGYGSGTIYKLGTHQVLEYSVLHTKMFVQPEGVDSIASDWWLMTPATNHTDSATEFVGIYASHLDDGWFGIFARPCTEEYPCPDGDTSNGWQDGWSWPFSEFACNTSEIEDQGNHLQVIMHYANETEMLDMSSPPLWQNSIYLWNYCIDEWDLIWRHEYRENKRDCSVEGCYRWGPILETIGTQDEINELGYEDSLLLHDDRMSILSPDVTDFIMPISPWLLMHLDPNRGYGVGNRYVMAPLSISIDIKPFGRPAKENKVNLRSRGSISVALLSDTAPDSQFDPPSQVDVQTVEFGPNGASPIRYTSRDINRDGLGDLILRFIIQEAGFSCGDTEATLTAETYDGQSLSGSDSIKTVCPR
jgi:hypothetical protein